MFLCFVSMSDSIAIPEIISKTSLTDKMDKFMSKTGWSKIPNSKKKGHRMMIDK